LNSECPLTPTHWNGSSFDAAADSTNQAKHPFSAGSRSNYGELRRPQTANRIGRTAHPLEELPNLFSDSLRFLVFRLRALGSLGFGGEHNARERIPSPERIGANLMSPAGQASHIVESRGGIKKTFLAEDVQFAFGPEECGQLQQQSLSIYRLPEKLPRAGPIGLKTLSAS
jgi:hypothetical protein